MSESRIIYGRRAFLEVCRHRPTRLLEVHLSPSLKLSKELSDALAGLDDGLVRIVRSEKAELSSLAGTSKHQGIVCRVFGLEILSEAELLRMEPGDRLVLALDQIGDPQNLGAILRAAGAFGVGAVLVSDRRSARLTPAVSKASAGASEIMSVFTATNFRRVLERLRERGYWIVGASLDERAVDLESVEIPSPTVLVLGSEGRGLRRLTAETCDVLVAISMPGLIESLNVGQAASVFLYELSRRARRERGKESRPRKCTSQE